jgi:glycosyltransferase involved in cell wall biosynthesis
VTGRRPISVVVPTRDRADFLDGCLKGLRVALDDADELIVADSASRDQRVRDVAEANDATYVRCEQPGASRARNEGWRRARHDIVAFIDDDILVDEDWANALVRAFDEYPDAAFVTGQVDFPRDEWIEYPVAVLIEPEPFSIDRDCAVDPGHGANFAARRRALEAVGGFDELLGAGAKFPAAEDKDVMDRLISSGERGQYDPRISVLHVPWRSRREIVRLTWTYGLGSGVRMAKLLKTDRSRVLQQVKLTFWTWAGVELRRARHHHNKFLAVLVLERTLAMFLGLAWALPARVRDGHFRERRWRLREART